MFPVGKVFALLLSVYLRASITDFFPNQICLDRDCDMYTARIVFTSYQDSPGNLQLSEAVRRMADKIGPHRPRSISM